jgi:hypothetical protein
VGQARLPHLQDLVLERRNTVLHVVAELDQLSNDKLGALRLARAALATAKETGVCVFGGWVSGRSGAGAGRHIRSGKGTDLTTMH